MLRVCQELEIAICHAPKPVSLHPRRNAVPVVETAPTLSDSIAQVAAICPIQRPVAFLFGLVEVTDMSTKILILFIAIATAFLFARNLQSKEQGAMTTGWQSQTVPHARTRAKAKITVHNSEAKPYDRTGGPALMEVRLSETFTGDIDGESSVRALQALRDDKSGTLVSIQRFSGKLGGHQGAFVLQGSEIVGKGRIKATWFVVPGSGTDDLSGLRGEGGFEGDFGKGSDGWLDYWFE
jgi:hypothetical protein